MKKPITLIGFMGSGKSTIGSQLAKEKKCDFIDLDQYIVRKTGKSIPDIFEAQGETGFREIETKSLIEVLDDSPKVIALGGGTPCFNQNMELINRHSTSIYLKVSPEALALRLSRSKNPRPLIKGLSDNELLSYIKEVLNKRESFYNAASHTIESDRIMLEDLLRLIII